MPSPILARADALMQRRLHGQAAADDIPTLTEAFGDDGIPLLLNTDTPLPAIEASTNNTAPSASRNAPADRFDSDLQDILVHELARRVEQRLIAELPKIIAATVRDFLAEQE